MAGYAPSSSRPSSGFWFRPALHETRAKFPGLFIDNLVFTDVTLGKGADAVVYAVEWNGTVCAAKRLHEILLEDESPGGAEKLISNFEAECLTWSKLRHPGVVQFLGVHLERSGLPVLVMEKMDTSLRKYVEDHSKEEFPLHQKTFVLRQVIHALAYLHSQKPPLVHHDFSPNNVLLNAVSLVTKVSDFGMSRTIKPSALSRKSSIKGTLAFMAPEALQNVPKYDTKLDVFSFGNVVITTLTHKWPDPEAPTKYEGGQLVAVSELQRREHCTELFTAQEKQLFLPTVCLCLDNRPDKRPSSVMLVQELRRIESSLTSGHVVAPIEQLRQQLSAKEEECRQKDEALKKKDEVIREKEAALMENDVALREKDKALKEKDEVIREKEAVLTNNDVALRAKDAVLREKDKVLKERDEVIREKEAELQHLRNERKEGDRATPGLGKQLVAGGGTEQAPKPKLMPKPCTGPKTVAPKTAPATVKKKAPPAVPPKAGCASRLLPSPADATSPLTPPQSPSTLGLPSPPNSGAPPSPGGAPPLPLGTAAPGAWREKQQQGGGAGTELAPKPKSKEKQAPPAVSPKVRHASGLLPPPAEATLPRIPTPPSGLPSPPPPAPNAGAPPSPLGEAPPPPFLLILHPQEPGEKQQQEGGGGRTELIPKPKPKENQASPAVSPIARRTSGLLSPPAATTLPRIPTPPSGLPFTAPPAPNAGAPPSPLGEAPPSPRLLMLQPQEPGEKQQQGGGTELAPMYRKRSGTGGHGNAGSRKKNVVPYML